MEDSLGPWTVYYVAYETDHSWLVGEGLADVTAALALRQRYLDEYPGATERGQAYVIAPADPWPHCQACHRAMQKIAGIPRCVYDACPRGTRLAIREAIRGIVRDMADSGREL